MNARATTQSAADSGADTIAVGVFDGDAIAHDLDGAPLQALLNRGEAKSSFKHLAVTHFDDGRRAIVVGLGKREAFDARRARAIAAVVAQRATQLGGRVLCWELPHHLDDQLTTAIVDGTIQSAYRFDAFRSPDEDEPPRLEELVVSDHDDRSAIVGRAATIAAAVSTARDLQNTPANVMTPLELAKRARELPGITVETLGRDEIVAAGMGAFAAVAWGSYAEPQLIVLRYEPPNPVGPKLALVGKAVTFDTGGISIKPSSGMEEMKFDMSGGAAVVAAVGAIAALELPLSVLGVVGATENMPSGRSMRPGDIVTASNGTTIEINNTDAEGRLVLSDCLHYAVTHGAERIVDLATLTGAIVVSLGTPYGGLMASDDAWAEAVTAAGAATGERVWRLPLDDEYDEMIKGRYADITNLSEKRMAGSITAAQFLHRFTGDVPWAHLDIAAVANDTGWAEAAKGGTGFGVRLLVELADGLATNR